MIERSRLDPPLLDNVLSHPPHLVFFFKYKIFLYSVKIFWWYDTICVKIPLHLTVRVSVFFLLSVDALSRIFAKLAAKYFVCYSIISATEYSNTIFRVIVPTSNVDFQFWLKLERPDNRCIAG